MPHTRQINVLNIPANLRNDGTRVKGVGAYTGAYEQGETIKEEENVIKEWFILDRFVEVVFVFRWHHCGIIIFGLM